METKTQSKCYDQVVDFPDDFAVLQRPLSLEGAKAIRRMMRDAGSSFCLKARPTIALADDTRPPMEFSFTVMSASHKEEALL